VQSSVPEFSDTFLRYRLLADKRIHAVARIESSLLKGARRYFDEQGFTEVKVPHLTRATGACENIDTMFAVPWFGEGERFLAQTGQLYLEVMTPYLKHVWCEGPSFRAEPDVDSRHLAEFPLLEIEFEGGFEELLGHVEGTIRSMVSTALAERKDDMEVLGVADPVRLDLTSPGSFGRMTYSEAVEKLGLSFGDDLKHAHEKRLVEMTGGKPLFVTHYPKSVKFFNMKENDDDPRLVNSADLLLPFSGEAVGAAEREFEYERLLARLQESSMFRLLRARGGGLGDFAWYLNYYRDFGGSLHSGCGIGFNRVTQYFLGADDIRGATVWPVNRESGV
jgi:asparaginyl-tRNA synthetase